AIESGYMKTSLVRSMAERVTRIAKGEITVVGVNKWQEGIESPLVGGDDGGLFKLDGESVKETLESLKSVRSKRDAGRAKAALQALKAAARSGDNMMEASVECALARVTTGEWAGALREVFGEYRPVTGIEGQRLGLEGERVEALRKRIQRFTDERGRRPRIVVGKPGLDGHSNGAEMIAVSARHVGFDVVYSGIRLRPDEIVTSAIEESADVIGASVLSGSHIELAEQLMKLLEEAGAGDRIQVIFGGIIPQSDFERLSQIGIRAVFTPKDYELIDIMERIFSLIETPAAAAE
ncbi:MAG: cobalamin-dependent protein, partial [Myxococcales bacterium]|nr:cobalamin-dependent protein [Myxococcales bacterium]